jgi:hypothetical protein
VAALAKLVFASWLAAAALPATRIPVPPPAELAERSERIRSLVRDASRPPDQRVESAAGRIDAAVRQVAERNGENSVESVQAATEAGVALITDWERFDLALPYIERALALSRAVFGTEHRETAYALQDLAVVRNELRPELFVQWSEPLAQESIRIRRKVLGPEHLETAGSERFLASWIYESWSRQRQRNARSPMLPEARDLAQHALGVLEAAYGVSHHEVVGTRYLLTEIALEMQEFALAEDLGLQLVYRYEVPCHTVDEGPSVLELVADALRAQARFEEAEKLAAAAKECDAENGSH